MKVRQKALRTGWTTGTCAAAAAKAATTALATGEQLPTVDTPLPGGERVTLAVDSYEVVPARATAVVVKDAGDDPDVTHGAHLTATVSWREGGGAGAGEAQSASASAIRLAGGAIELEGGEGVGVVTKPGLGLEIGGPAINPVPRAMI